MAQQAAKQVRCTSGTRGAAAMSYASEGSDQRWSLSPHGDTARIDRRPHRAGHGRDTDHTARAAASEVPLLYGAGRGLLAASDMGMQVRPTQGGHEQNHRRSGDGRANTATVPVKYGGDNARHRLPDRDWTATDTGRQRRASEGRSGCPTAGTDDTRTKGSHDSAL